MTNETTAKTLAHDVVRTFRQGSYLVDEALEKVIYAVLLDALDAREAQTTCWSCNLSTYPSCRHCRAYLDRAKEPK